MTELQINGRPVTVEAVPGTSLLEVLRTSLGLTGSKQGCLEGECGACTVLIDGRPLDACLVPVHAVGRRPITTIEGLGRSDRPSELQQAIVDAGGVQCGFCTPGIIMVLEALLAEISVPTSDEVRAALAGNICRCTGYAQIVDAVVAMATKPSRAGARS